MLTTVHLEEIVLELRALKPIPRRIGVLGITPSTAAVIAALRAAGFSDEIAGVIQAGDTPHVTQRIAGVPVVPPGEQIANFDVVVVASDRDKELLLRHYRASLAATSAHDLLPVILFAGSAHLGFDDRVPNTVLGDILPLSLANGYPNSLPHLYEALASVAARHLPGAIVEFGAYRGGTTAFLAKAARALGYRTRIIAFESFRGFPPRRDLLDLYAHPAGFFRDESAVRRYLEPLGVELIAGDIIDTVRVLVDVPIALAFVDTDNYTSAAAALEYVVPQTLVGGVIVFDHYTGDGAHLYTLGERLAAQDFVPRDRFLNLHQTGVFVRLA